MNRCNLISVLSMGHVSFHVLHATYRFEFVLISIFIIFNVFTLHFTGLSLFYLQEILPIKIFFDILFVHQSANPTLFCMRCTNAG